MKNELQQNKMGTSPILKLIVSMSLPSMFSMIIQSLYNVVDSIFVGKISEKALTAVSLAFPLQMLIVAVGVGTGIGINSLISRRLGEGRREEADSAAVHGVVLAFFSWLVFALVGLFFSKGFISMFTKDAELNKLGTDYLSIVMIFSFGAFFQMNFEKTLQATGNMIYPMIFQLTGAVTNIILDPIFIFVFDMGVSGAAVATVLGQILSMTFASYIMFFKKHEIVISFKNFRLNFKIIADIYKVGLPSIIMQSIGSVLITGLNAILGALNQTAVAVLGVYYKLQSFIFMPVFGLTHGVMPIIGFNYGARNKSRVMQTFKYGCIISLIIMAIGTLIFMVFPAQLLMMFDASENMIQIGTVALRTISLCFIPAAIGIMCSTIFQAVGSGVRSLVISLLRQLIINLPCAFFLAKFGLDYVWLAFPIAEAFSFAVGLILFADIYKRRLKNL